MVSETAGQTWSDPRALEFARLWKAIPIAVRPPGSSPRSARLSWKRCAGRHGRSPADFTVHRTAWRVERLPGTVKPEVFLPG